MERKPEEGDGLRHAFIALPHTFRSKRYIVLEALGMRLAYARGMNHHSSEL